MSSSTSATPLQNSSTIGVAQLPPGGRFRIPSLDGIRAIAIAIVFVAHCGLSRKVPGGFGVTVFFFLSGYLISTLLRREYAKTSTINFGAFYMRRIIRIFPPFYCALLLAIVLQLNLSTRNSVEWGNIGWIAAHVGNYAQIFGNAIMPSGTHVYWSLAVEEHFYLTFPLLALALFRKQSRRITLIVLVAIATAIMSWRFYLVSQEVPFVRIYLSSDTRVDSILWGCILALVQNPMLDKRLGWPTPLKLVTLVVCLTALLFSFLYRDNYFRQTYRFTLQSIALAPLFYLAIRNADWPIFRWLDLAPIRYFGVLSYTFYLIHHSLLWTAEYLFSASLPELARRVLAGLTALALASLSYHFMEKPLGQLRKRYH